MADILQLRRSAVASKVPLTTDLALGELAINTYDGKVYIKKDNGTESIVDLTASSLPTQTGNSGKFLTTDGTNTSWATAGGSSSPSLNILGPIVCESDFIKSWPYNDGNGQPTTGIVDGFYVTNENKSSYPIVITASEANHPGIIRVTTGNATQKLIYGQGGYSTGSTTPMVFITGDTADSFTVITRRNATSTRGFIGFMSSADTDSPSTSIGVRFSASVLYCRTSVSSSVTEATLTGGMASNTWIRITVKRNTSGYFEFYANDTLVQTLTTNIPTTQLMLFGAMFSSSSSGNQDIDYLGMKTTTLTR